MMASVQMNTRIDFSLKSLGDLAIRESGHTPSEVVRAVWNYAARNRHKPKAIAALLDFLDGAQPTEKSGVGQAHADEIVEQVMRGPRLIEAFCAERGLSSSSLEPTTYADLKSAAFDDDWPALP